MNKRKATSQGSVAQAALELVYGPRERAYGHPAENFKHIVSVFNAAFKHKLRTPFNVNDWGQIMVLMKTVRQISNPSVDNLVDQAGYAEATYRALTGS